MLISTSLILKQELARGALFPKLESLYSASLYFHKLRGVHSEAYPPTAVGSYLKALLTVYTVMFPKREGLQIVVFLLRIQHFLGLWKSVKHTNFPSFSTLCAARPPSRSNFYQNFGNPQI